MHKVTLSILADQEGALTFHVFVTDAESQEEASIGALLRLHYLAAQESRKKRDGQPHDPIILRCEWGGGYAHIPPELITSSVIYVDSVEEVSGDSMPPDNVIDIERHRH